MIELSKVGNIVNSFLIIIAGIYFHIQYTIHTLRVEAPSHFKFGFVILFPASVLISYVIIKIFKVKRNVLDYMTIFAAVFGIMTAFYFLWVLKV
jgi:hypothetical protein